MRAWMCTGGWMGYSNSAFFLFIHEHLLPIVRGFTIFTKNISIFVFQSIQFFFELIDIYVIYSLPAYDYYRLHSTCVLNMVVTL
jgi:hypothetical protein